MPRKIIFLLVIGLVAVSTTGCIKFKKKAVTVGDLGGVFVTENRMENWAHKSYIMTPGETPGSLAGVNVNFIEYDPQDDEALYIGTDNGLYSSYGNFTTSGKISDGWMKSRTLPEGYIGAFVVDPKNKCTLYAAVLRDLYKSTDCGRTWASKYTSDGEDRRITALDIDWYEPKILYMGLQDGTLLKSEDSGNFWKNAYEFKKRVDKIVVDPNNSFNVYVAVDAKGLRKSEDKGANWIVFDALMKDFYSFGTFYDFDISKEPKDVILYACKEGLLRSKDGGQTWNKVELTTQTGQEVIYALELDPTDANKIYYATDVALYKTIDGGVNWANKKMETTRVARDLLVHPKNPSIIYMGVKTLNK